MFFYIGDKKPFNSLQQVYDRLYLDYGWSTSTIANKKVWYKGYSTECRLSDKISEIIEGYQPTGKWCVIDDDYQVYHPALRGFPIYEYQDQLSTFCLENFQIKVYEHDYSNLEGGLSFDQAVSQITDILVNNTDNFLKYNDVKNLNIVFTAGLDSLTAWTVFHQVSKNYKLSVKDNMGYRNYESDLFPYLDKLWGYQVSNFYDTHNYNVSGFYGERITFREVDTAHIVANYIKRPVMFSLRRTDYLYHFMNRPSSVVNNYPRYKDIKDVYKWCYDRIYYDYQMWHLDNNFVFCPLYDLNIAKIVYKLPLDVIIENQKNGTIQRKVIEKINPDMLSLLSEYKNSGNIWGNFDKNFEKISPLFEQQLKK